jgi:hypothetical protein
MQKGEKMETKDIASVGFYAAVLTTLLTVISFGIAIMTPPLSGPYCTGGCFGYPFSDIVSHFPRDYYWMYSAMLLNVVYYVLMVAIHYFAPVEKKIFRTCLKNVILSVSEGSLTQKTADSSVA